MIEIVPAVLVRNRQELVERLKRVEPFVKKVQIDTMDGKFVPNVTVKPRDFESVKTKLKMEFHLMVEEPEGYVDALEDKAYMSIVHLETCRNVGHVIKRIRGYGAKVGLALNPETPVSAVSGYLNKIDQILVMTVRPGFGGQEFLPEMLRKIRELRAKDKRINLEVDGGIKVGTARLAAWAGANILVANTAIYGHEDVGAAIQTLKLDAEQGAASSRQPGLKRLPRPR